MESNNSFGEDKASGDKDAAFKQLLLLEMEGGMNI